MKISFKKRVLIICAYLGPAVCGLGGFASPVSAQDAPASKSASLVASAPPATAVLSDGELQKRVKAALHADPYFYDKHVTVSVERGAVVLRGFVFSGWELQDAVRIARKAAGNARVIDDLSIQLGGR